MGQSVSPAVLGSMSTALDQAAYWRDVELPDAWPDQIGFKQPRHLARMIGGLVTRKTRPLIMPEALTFITQDLPKYLFQEFHHLPNGNYSKRISKGYARSFDHVMLGELKKARMQLAAHLKDCHRVLDLGVGGGHMANSLLATGVPEVWGIEPSPYLLQLTATQFPDIKLRHGVAEKTDFPDQHFDAVVACFVFHEIPPRYADQVLKEAKRILKPGGILAWIEPSPTQLQSRVGELWRAYGWRGWYFRTMAKRMHEPFVDAWHKRNKQDWLQAHRFELIEQLDQMPWERVMARVVK